MRAMENKLEEEVQKKENNKHHQSAKKSTTADHSRGFRKAQLNSRWFAPRSVVPALRSIRYLHYCLIKVPLILSTLGRADL